MIPLFLSVGTQVYPDKGKILKRNASLQTSTVSQKNTSKFSAWFDTVRGSLHFCAGPDRTENNRSSNEERAKKRKQQIQRLANKYLPNGKLTILRRGAIEGARTMDDPWTVESTHYTVKTDISRKAAGEIALLMELLYDALLRSPFFPDKEYAFDRISVVVPKNRGEFTDIAPGALTSDDRGAFKTGSEKPAIYAYYFSNEKHRNLINVLLFHGTRQFLNTVSTVDLPQWLEHGFCRVYEYSNFQEMKLVPGKPSVRYLRNLHEELRFEGPGPYQYLEPFPKLIRQDDTLLNEDDYAQMWGLVHFLINWKGGKLVDSLAKHIQHFRSVEEQKRDPVQLFQKHFGFHPEKLRTPWERYILNLRY